MEKIKLILCDMDGTLLNSKKEEPKDFRKIVRELVRRKILVGIASGRQYVTLKNQFLDIYDDLIFISDNGTIVFHHDKCIYNNPMQLEDIKEIKKIIEKSKTSFMVCCGLKGAYAFNRDEEFTKNANQYCKNLTIVNSVEEIRDIICKIAIYDLYDAKQNILPLLKNLKPELSAVHSSFNWVDISNADISKGSAVKMIQQMYQITKEETMAFGDYLNDLEMLREAKYSYAMANAIPEIKEAANFIAPSNDEEGVIKIIKEVLEVNCYD